MQISFFHFLLLFNGMFPTNARWSRSVQHPLTRKRNSLVYLLLLLPKIAWNVPRFYYIIYLWSCILQNLNIPINSKQMSPIINFLFFKGIFFNIKRFSLVNIKLHQRYFFWISHLVSSKNIFSLWFFPFAKFNDYLKF